MIKIYKGGFFLGIMKGREGLIFVGLFLSVVLLLSFASAATSANTVASSNQNNFWNQLTGLWNKLTGHAVAPSSLDTTPRIAYWWGKVNQHVENGVWTTDPDGTSGANLDKLTYCKKWYPHTVSVEPYKNETISGWLGRGNIGTPLTSTKQSYECVQESQVTNDSSYCNNGFCKIYDSETAGQFSASIYGDNSVTVEYVPTREISSLLSSGDTYSFSAGMKISSLKIATAQVSGQRSFVQFSYENAPVPTNSYCYNNVCYMYDNSFISSSDGFSFEIPQGGIKIDRDGNQAVTLLVNNQSATLRPGDTHNYQNSGFSVTMNKVIMDGTVSYAVFSYSPVGGTINVSNLSEPDFAINNFVITSTDKIPIAGRSDLPFFFNVTDLGKNMTAADVPVKVTVSKDGEVIDSCETGIYLNWFTGENSIVKGTCMLNLPSGFLNFEAEINYNDKFNDSHKENNKFSQLIQVMPAGTSCNDSDGQNSFVAGTTSGYNIQNFSYGKYGDYCAGPCTSQVLNRNTGSFDEVNYTSCVKEYSCISVSTGNGTYLTGGIDSRLIGCQFGCNAGKCLNSNETNSTNNSIGTCEWLSGDKLTYDTFSCGMGDNIKNGEVVVKDLNVDSPSKGSVVLESKGNPVNPVSQKLGVNDSWFTYDGDFYYLFTVNKFIPATNGNKAKVIFTGKELNLNYSLPGSNGCFTDKSVLDNAMVLGDIPVLCGPQSSFLSLLNITSINSDYVSLGTNLFPSASKLSLNSPWTFSDQDVSGGPLNGTNIDGFTIAFEGENNHGQALMYILNPYNLGSYCYIRTIRSGVPVLACEENASLVQGVKYVSSSQNKINIETNYPFKNSKEVLGLGDNFNVYYPNGEYYGTFTFESFDGTSYQTYSNGTKYHVTYPVTFLANVTSFNPSNGNIVTPSCNGCSVNGNCFDFGYRMNGSFCSPSGFVQQLTDNSACQNDFECSSNLCISSQCVSGSVWNKFLNWFQNLFG